MRLLAPIEYFSLPQSTIDTFKCGPSNGTWKEKIVPETIYGLPVTAACGPHDYMYIVGYTDDDKIIADAVFGFNLLLIIQQTTDNKLLAWARRRRAYKYIDAVMALGTFNFDKWPEKKTGFGQLVISEVS